MQKSLHHHRGQPCSGISHMPFAVIKAKDMPQPQLAGGGGGWRFRYGARSESQVWLIRVESRFRGATVGGNPSPTVEGYLKQPPTSRCLGSIVFLCTQSYFAGG
jgi:hypothetical protein